MMRIMASEFLKIKRKMILFLVFLGPFGVIGLEAVNFGLAMIGLRASIRRIYGEG